MLKMMKNIHMNIDIIVQFMFMHIMYDDDKYTTVNVVNWTTSNKT